MSTFCYKDANDGFYIPSFLFLHVDTTDDLTKINGWSDASKATFYHEYIHFIQDISTIYGLFNIIHTVDYIKALVKELRENTSREITLPVNVSDEKVKINIDLESLYRGDTFKDFSVSKFGTYRIAKDSLYEGYPDDEYVLIKCLDHTRKECGDLHFGAACIRESMAYEEENIINKKLNLDFIPYKTVRQLIMKYAGPSYVFPIHIIALCDIALNSTNPGKHLIKFLDLAKQKDFNPKQNSSYLYEIAIDEMRLIGSDQKECTIPEKFNQISKIAEIQIKSLFTNENCEPIRVWLSDVFSTVRKIRRKNFDFVINRAPFSLIEEIGFPLMSNAKNEYASQHPRHDISSKILLLRAVFEIFMVLKGKQKGCEMLNFCNKTLAIDYNLCSKSPWKQTNKDKLCPFAQIWKMWGLEIINDKLS